MNCSLIPKPVPYPRFCIEQFWFRRFVFDLFAQLCHKNLQVFGLQELSCAISLRIGIDCSQTLPVAHKVAGNNPSPPNTIERILPTCWISNAIEGFIKGNNHLPNTDFFVKNFFTAFL